MLSVSRKSAVGGGVRQGVNEVAHGSTHRVGEVFDEIGRKHKIPRLTARGNVVKDLAVGTKIDFTR